MVGPMLPVGSAVGAAVGAAVVGAAVGVAVGAAVGEFVSPILVGVAVGAAVGSTHAVNISVALLPVSNVKGPATVAPPPTSFSVHVAPFQPSPKLSSMFNVCVPDVRETD